MNTVNEVQESIKIALDAADAATDVTSEYNKIKNDHKIKAILPVHFAGKPVDMKSVYDIAEQYGVDEGLCPTY